VELINGSLVRSAQANGVAVPLQEAIYALVRGKEASYS
jgi:ketopantoate reductase